MKLVSGRNSENVEKVGGKQYPSIVDVEKEARLSCKLDPIGEFSVH